ncbi:radical SAM family heme chaperone HemW [Deinococcus lacus]|uniref:Heme chaperone HemW n=1 Tax=Deinococcus lacus TaxID=392561 RepID=A0ABW1YD81_9DEIO
MPALSPLRHLYVHVPFCPSICPYCDFHVLTRQAGLVERYLARLDEEAQALADAYPVDLDTVYVGGGTPSFLRDAELAALTSSVRRHLGWGQQENTLEINPGTVSQPRAAHWQALGFDRASVGVQSLDNSALQFLGRHHDAQQATDALGTLLRLGMRVSGDLMTALAGQPLEDDIQRLAASGVGHISAYTLTIESGTEFARRGIEVTDEDERRGFLVTAERLSALGFRRYEISNYARPGQESRHNLAYWEGRFYLGLGPGAAGHYPAPPGSPPGVLAYRWTNPPLHEWLAGAKPEKLAIDAHEYVTDALFMGLRLSSGINLDALSERAGLNVQQTYAGPLAANLRRGLLVLEQGQLRATQSGWWSLNRVVADFL